MATDPTDLPRHAGLPLDDDLSGELTEDELPTVEVGEEDLAASDAAAVPDKAYFRIGEVAQIVGVDAHVLRYWESEFKMKPQRSSSGQRLYRKADLARFLRIKSLLHDEGYTIAGARKILSGQIQLAPSAGGADAAKLREILSRVEELRHKLRALREELDPQPRVDSFRRRG